MALALTVVGHAHAQKAIQVPPPTGLAKPPAVPLPPPLSRNEGRYRELATYIKTRGELDPATRVEVEKLAVDIDVDLAAPTTDREQMLRLLPARAQMAIWLDDSAAMDSAFERLVAMTPATEAVVLAWARQLNREARFEKTITVLEGREFTTPARSIDAKIVLADALIGLNRFEPAQAELNTAPALGRSSEQLAAISLFSRRASLGRNLFNRELGAQLKDQKRGDLPTVELMTTKGSIIVELFEEQAPNTVGNFIEHVELGTYNGTTFHRIMRGFGVQGGDPATASGAAGGRGTGGWVTPDECTLPDHRVPMAGRLVMARQGASDGPVKPAANSAGCQFTILTGPAESLDGVYTVFGRVIDGMDRVTQLRADDLIVTATVLFKRKHEYKGVRLGEGRAGEYLLPRAGIPLTPVQAGEVSPSPTPNSTPASTPIPVPTAPGIPSATP